MNNSISYVDYQYKFNIWSTIMYVLNEFESGRYSTFSSTGTCSSVNYEIVKDGEIYVTHYIHNVPGGVQWG